MIVRLFLSAVAATDVDDLVRLFREDVVPAFEAHSACLGIELVFAVDADVGGLVEGGALSRWTNREEMEKALDEPPLVASQERIRELLRREPVRKTYEVVA